MSKKSFAIFIVVLIAILGFLGWYFLFGTTKPLPTTPQGNNGNLFPFGQGPVATSTPGKAGGNAGTSSPQVINLGGGAALPRLRQISKVPTAGAIAFDVASTTVIRYVERATGHIYETPSESADMTQISNITIPKVYEALWSSDGSSLILRYLKDDQATIRTFVAKIVATSSPEKAIEGSFLADGIQSISVWGNKLFYLSENADGAQGVRANMDGTGKTAVFNSTFGDWASSWSSKDVVLYPRPTAFADGGAYVLDPATGSYSKKQGDVQGLAALLSPDESYLLYSGRNSDIPGTAILDLKTGESHDAGVATLAEKCVWSKKQKTVVYCAVPKSPDAAAYPDDWYKGKVSFQDSLWKIDAATGVTETVFDPELEAGISMDMTDLGLDQSESTLIFTNKDDMTVWRYDLNPS